MSNSLLTILTLLFAVGIIFGIKLMSSPKSARQGNLLGSFCMLGAIVATLVSNQVIDHGLLWIAMAIGAAFGYFMATRVAMIQMPQFVALLNGFGGGASALVAIVVVLGGYHDILPLTVFTSMLALAVGGMTFSGSLVAGAKLDGRMQQKPIQLPHHTLLSMGLAALLVLLVAASPFMIGVSVLGLSIVVIIASLLFGVIFTIRVGGADMPVTISLLNSFSGLAAAIAGFAVYNPLLVAVGAVVGAAGIILTQIMCKAMNRSLWQVLSGKIKTKGKRVPEDETTNTPHRTQDSEDLLNVIQKKFAQAKSVIIIPGYGMAVAQAQELVRDLIDNLEEQGKDVKLAIHPVAGRMPGHMNVLLAEVDVPYDKLYDLDAINDEFPHTDLVLVVGANDVVNPAAISHADTPIYGMPILRADQSKHIIICNYDTQPGYSGVANPLYSKENVTMLLGDAKATLADIKTVITNNSTSSSIDTQQLADTSVVQARSVLQAAKSVIIIPGYGMAVAQAQMLVKQLVDYLEARGKNVKIAIHPVAGRMPGHMNVLLAEVDLPYDKLYDMDTINDDFASTDAVLVVGANDVVNPAAIDQEDTPIYGMPILRADQAAQVIVCNYDLQPGYSGVANPLYHQENTIVVQGDAAETLKLLFYEEKLEVSEAS